MYKSLNYFNNSEYWLFQSKIFTTESKQFPIFYYKY